MNSKTYYFSFRCFFFKTKYSLYSSVSPSQSSTRIQNGSALPCSLSSQWKSGVTIISIYKQDLVIGWTNAAISILGNWWMNLCRYFPKVGNFTVSPIYYVVRLYYWSQLSCSFFSILLRISSGIPLNYLKGVMHGHICLFIILQQFKAIYAD